ncbi:MAG: RHS repeat-associated core domain-containing protein, partial [Bacteroidota bacterium]
DSTGNTSFGHNSILGRGYTGHEHCFEVGLIHMNGRMYDAQLGRFLSPDNYVQDPYNTQNFNRYGYVLNNPLVYGDPSGEAISLLGAIVVGALVGIGTNGIINTIEGRGFFEGAVKAGLIGAVGGAASFGIGELAGTIGTGLTQSGQALAQISFQAAAHGVLGGVMSDIQGGDFLSGFAGGALGSAVAGGTQKFLNKATKFWKDTATIASGALSGGLGTSIAGGRFWDGVRNGVISSALNHVAHDIAEIDPEKLKARIEKDGRLTRREANRWFKYGNGKPLNIDASKIDLDFLGSSEWQITGDRVGVQTLYASKDGLVYGQLSVEYIGDNQFKIFNDNYGFELHSGIENTPRNLFTILGRIFAGPFTGGIPFDINFYNRINTVDVNNNKHLISR